MAMTLLSKMHLGDVFDTTYGYTAIFINKNTGGFKVLLCGQKDVRMGDYGETSAGYDVLFNISKLDNHLMKKINEEKE